MNSGQKSKQLDKNDSFHFEDKLNLSSLAPKLNSLIFMVDADQASVKKKELNKCCTDLNMPP